MISPHQPGRLGSLKVSIPITVGFLAAIVTGGLTLASEVLKFKKKS